MTRILAALVLLGFALLAPSPPVRAQALEIDIVGGVAAALPIAVVPMPYLGTQAPPDTDVAAVIAANLNRSGQFRTLAEAQLVEKPIRGSEIQFPTWRVLKQDFLVIGRILDAPEGGYRVEYELWDVARQERLIGLSMTARLRGMRDLAHQISDQIYEKILGQRGAFWTRIAYVTSTGIGADMQFSLVVADADGFNPQTVVRSREPLMSPSWSPDGRRLAYVSFERGNSTIYIQELTTGARETVASFRGINGSPAFSPDGTRLALTLSRSGNPEIYVMDLASRALTPITRHFAIDTEPTWMPDGQSLVFTSDRAGRPQLYQVPVTGGEPTRLTFEGNDNTRATVSFDGKKIAMAQGNRNVYRIAVLDRSLAQPRWITVSPGNLDESPSFAPNAGMLLYATKEGGRGVLYAVSTDARVRQRLVLADGDVREPAWSPFRQR